MLSNPRIREEEFGKQWIVLRKVIYIILKTNRIYTVFKLVVIAIVLLFT